MEQEYTFEVDENGEIIYTEGDDGNDSLFDPGDPVLDPESDMELMPEEVPEDPTFSDPGFVDPVAVVLSDEVTAALVAVAPAPGSMNSSVLDYFDRIVNGLDPDWGYAAYRTDADDAYAAALYFGEKWEYEDDQLIFTGEAFRIDALRTTSGSGYNNYIMQYYLSDADDAVVDLSIDGSYIFYSNAAPGYANLGTYERSEGYGILMAFLFFLLIIYIAVRRFLFND